jgi:hypothetical protein
VGVCEFRFCLSLTLLFCVVFVLSWSYEIGGSGGM